MDAPLQFGLCGTFVCLWPVRRAACRTSSARSVRSMSVSTPSHFQTIVHQTPEGTGTFSIRPRCGAIPHPPWLLPFDQLSHLRRDLGSDTVARDQILSRQSSCYLVVVRFPFQNGLAELPSLLFGRHNREFTQVAVIHDYYVARACQRDIRYSSLGHSEGYE